MKLAAVPDRLDCPTTAQAYDSDPGDTMVGPFLSGEIISAVSRLRA
jgi:hypothetical protein